MPRISFRRFALPAVVAGAVGLVGLLTFLPPTVDVGAATSSPSTTTTSTTSTSTTTTSTSTSTTTSTTNPYSSTTNPYASVSGSTPTGMGSAPVVSAPPTSQLLAQEQGVHVPGGAPITYENLPASYIAPGQQLYESNCASCHGTGATGGYGPPLNSLGAGTVDFWVSTGRMPLKDASIQAARKQPQFDRLQTLEIAAYVQSTGTNTGIALPAVNLAGADVSSGNQLFTLNCAACHTIEGSGDALYQGAWAPSLKQATLTQIVEAIRTGPGNMPRFGPGDITDTQARDIAAFVHGVIQHPTNRGGFGLGGVGPVAEGFVGLLLGVGALMLVSFWIGDRT